MSKKAKNKKKAKKPTAAQRRTIKAQQTQRQMWAVVLFAVGLLFLALTFIKGSKAWLATHNVLFGLLGWGAYAVAPMILYVAFIAARDKPISSMKHKLWQIGVLIFLFSGAIEIFTGLPETEGFTSLIKALYHKGVAQEGGGVFGVVLAWPLLSLADTTGAKIIIVLAIFVFLMILTGSTLRNLFQMLRKPVDGLQSAYSHQVEERERRQQDIEENGPRFRFDFPKKKEKTLSFSEEQGLGTKETESFRTAQGSTGEEPPSQPQDTGEREFYDNHIPPAQPPPHREARFDIDVDISDDLDPQDFSAEDVVEVPELETQETAFYEGLSKAEAPADSWSPPLSEKTPSQTPFGVDTPVEYISVTPQPKPDPVEIPDLPQYSRPHPLEEDIRLAREEDLSQEIDDYLEQIETGEEPWEHEPTELSEGDSFRVDLGDYGHEIIDVEESVSPESIPLPTSVTQQIESQRPMEVLEEQNLPEKPELITPPPSKEEEKAKSVKKNTPTPDLPEEQAYRFPPLELLQKKRESGEGNITQELHDNGDKLVETLESFGVQTKIINISRGPAVTRYELQPSAGVKISRITGLADDIALNLAASGIRIEAPIPNKAAVGIEVPNQNISMVPIRDVMDTKEFQKASDKVSVALGRDITGRVVVADIATTPHVLIAGATGSGKSVCINSMIISILYKYSPEEVKLLMIDPKVVELGVYNGIPHLLVPVVTNPKKAMGALAWAVSEMENRYKTFAEHGVRDIAGYNRMAEASEEHSKMPQIVIVIDELADLMMASASEVEESITRLAQMARAAGMHLVIATQRPSVDVITGVIKANIPSRIAFAVSSQVDSRTILDGRGAEKLLGRGDMLFYPIEAAKPTRIQGCFVSDQEIENVVAYIKETETPDYDDEIVEEIEKLTTSGGTAATGGGGFEEEDEKLGDAIEVVLEAEQASVSQLQRRLRVGYARAGRLIDTLEQMGIVGPHEGSKPRLVLMSKDEYMEMKLMNEDAPQTSEEREKNKEKTSSDE